MGTLLHHKIPDKKHAAGCFSRSLSLSRSLLFCCAFVCICLAFVWTRLALVWFGLCLLLLPLGPRAHWPCLAGSLACLFACLLACLMKSVREPANSLVRSGTPKNAQRSLVTTKLCLCPCSFFRPVPGRSAIRQHPTNEGCSLHPAGGSRRPEEQQCWVVLPNLLEQGNVPASRESRY